MGQHPDRFGDHMHCDIGDIMLLICHETSSDHMFKGLCELMNGSSPLQVTVAMFGGHWVSANGDIKCLICLVN